VLFRSALSILALALAPALAEARPSGGKSSGSRGERTMSAPPATSTAPGAAQPMQRTMTPSTGAPTQPGVNATRPAASPAATAAAQQAKPSFARNLMMGIGAGLLGAGLFGLLSGSGLFGGLGGFASFLGLLLQAALIAGLIYLAIRFFRRRQEPELAAAGVGRLDRQMDAPQRQPMPVGGGAAPQGGSDMVGLTGADFGVFEKRLHAVTEAFSREDLAALRRLATPEMVGYFAEDLAENAREGVIDVTHDVKLLQGDLSEAWREGDLDYATVAMRFSFVGTLSERTTGRVVEGNATAPQEATEIWTFVRQRGGEWLLSAIQQTE
jgi:predicted lipid-binding transport protein (Tim44 family)